jgi:putative transposase
MPFCFVPEPGTNRLPTRSHASTGVGSFWSRAFSFPISYTAEGSSRIMARPQRIEIPDAFYHVSNGKKSGKPLFPSAEHVSIFLDQVRLAGQRLNVELHGWALNKHQYQLLIKTPEANLSRFMRQVDGLYTLRYQQLQARRGSVFRTRYKSVLVQSALAPAVLHMLHYRADRNAKAGLGDQASSLSAYLGQARLPFPVSTDELLGPCSKERAMQVKAALAVPPPMELVRFFARKSRPTVLGDADFKRDMRAVRAASRRNGTSMSYAVEDKRPPLSRIVAEVAQAFGVTETSILQAARGPDSKNIPRWVAMHLCQEVGGLTLQTIARHFGLQRYGTVSTTIGKLRAELPANPRLQKQVHNLVQELR